MADTSQLVAVYEGSTDSEHFVGTGFTGQCGSGGRGRRAAVSPSVSLCVSGSLRLAKVAPPSRRQQLQQPGPPQDDVGGAWGQAHVRPHVCSLSLEQIMGATQKEAGGRSSLPKDVVGGAGGQNARRVQKAVVKRVAAGARRACGQPSSAARGLCCLSHAVHAPGLPHLQAEAEPRPPEVALGALTPWTPCASRELEPAGDRPLRC